MSKILFVIELGGFPLRLDDLKAEGHEVEYVNNMRKAISLLKRFQPDILVPVHVSVEGLLETGGCVTRLID